ncbi:hypothetical protein IFR05_015874 [Cadophora sp. M221]|nr:hypothetical protein IFR05_015874 [Cadophora sp. M221]
MLTSVKCFFLTTLDTITETGVLSPYISSTCVLSLDSWLESKCINGQGSVSPEFWDHVRREPELFKTPLFRNRFQFEQLQEADRDLEPIFGSIAFEKLKNTQIFCSPPTPFPENNSWFKQKELNPDLTWKEWNLYPQGLQGGTLCPGMDDENSSEMTQIREWLLDQEMSEPKLTDLRSETINELSTRFFAETGFMQSPATASSDLIETADAAFCYFHCTACRQANKYEGFIVSDTLVKYFVTSDDDQVVEKLRLDIQSFSNSTLFELGEGMVFIVGNSKAHQGHETSLLLRKTQIQDGKQKWTLTWIDPCGFRAYNKEGYTSWNSYEKHRQEFEDEVMTLFRRIVESSVTASVEIEFCSLPVDNTSIARRAISEGGIQGLFESILDMETMELNQYRAIDWCATSADKMNRFAERKEGSAVHTISGKFEESRNGEAWRACSEER